MVPSDDLRAKLVEMCELAGYKMFRDEVCFDWYFSTTFSKHPWAKILRRYPDEKNYSGDADVGGHFAGNIGSG
jgi:hypothetical protein